MARFGRECIHDRYAAASGDEFFRDVVRLGIDHAAEFDAGVSEIGREQPAERTTCTETNKRLVRNCLNRNTLARPEIEIRRCNDNEFTGRQRFGPEPRDGDRIERQSDVDA